ncbi:IS701 family transposase [Rhodococcus jostii]|uniref:SRSO17 transposase n=1 Tax=Rhodococcus jostii TaxID=132919 RepID=A0A1H5LYQ4_RHOJO|nr:IS701 family transposase [Rhodococcus jostii]SEC82261.1 SRSO17 transposase [Rhodococcus jostii]SEE82136.1 SRSO17 transposase [Rhodococcus jostii]
MDTSALARVGEQLDTFAGEVFSSLARKDQRATAGVYVRGLMLDGRRKSMQPMAQRLRVDHQRLQQFVTTSPWDVTPVRKTLSRRACDLIDPDAWVIDDTGFTKDGDRSPGVARQYSGTLGKVGNCQIAVSVHAATDAASAPLDWRLFLPESWDDRSTTDPDAVAAITARRKRSAIPDTEQHRTKWEMAIEMIDELIAWGRIPPPAVADAGYGDTTAFREALTERGVDYVVAVKGATSAYPGDAVPEIAAYSGRGRPPTPRYGPHSSCKDLVLAAGRKALRTVTWRRGTKTDPDNPTAAMRSRFAAMRIRPANRDIPRAYDGTLPAVWLLAEWPTGADEPTDYWISTLPDTTPIAELVRLAKIRWRIEHDYRELKTGLGLDHFEGRSWLGWHHHATLVTAAHLFITTLRLIDPKATGRD